MSLIECVICTELLTDECILLHLECGHVFHDACVSRWIRESKTCPQCRVRVLHRPRRLYLQFAENTELASIQAREITLRDKVRLNEGIINSLEDTIRTFEAERIQIPQLKLNAEQLAVAAGRLRTALIQATNEKNAANCERENFKQKLEDKIRTLEAQLSVPTNNSPAAREHFEQKLDIIIAAVNKTANTNTNLSEQLKRADEKMLEMRTTNIALGLSKEKTERKLIDLQSDYSYMSLVEIPKLKSDIADLSARLEQCPVEFLRAENDLQNIDENSVDALHATTSENMMKKVTNEKTGKTLEKITTDFNKQPDETYSEMDSALASTPKHKNEENTSQQCTEQTKRQKLRDTPEL